MSHIDMNPILSNYGTNVLRDSIVVEDEGQVGHDLEVVCHVLYAQGFSVARMLNPFDGETDDLAFAITLETVSESSWEEIKDTLVYYLHCRKCDKEWIVDDLEIVET